LNFLSNKLKVTIKTKSKERVKILSCFKKEVQSLGRKIVSLQINIFSEMSLAFVKAI